MKTPAPILLFVYNRPLHTAAVLNALRNCDGIKDSVLYIFADGPKMGANEKEVKKIDEVKALCKHIDWCKEVVLYEQKFNKGLANSIIAGVTEIVNRHGKVIVLEDDIQPEKGFLTYMNQALGLYESDDKVMQVSAYIYPLKSAPSTSSFFLKILSCWGWGTWARAWKNYSHDIDAHLSFLNDTDKRDEFSLNGQADYYEQLLLNKSKNIYSWAVRWYASWFEKDGLSLFPATSLVKNIGFDGSGVHYTESNNVFISPTTEYIDLQKIDLIEEDRQIRNSVIDFYANRPDRKPHERLPQPGLYQRLKNGIKRLIPFYSTYTYYKKRAKEILNFPFDLYRPSNNSSTISTLAKMYPPYKISHSTIDDYTYVSINSIINNTTVGKFCSIGPNLVCGWGIHPIDGISTSPYFYSTHKQNGDTLSDYNKAVEQRPIFIGNDVFIGVNVTILDGVTIGDGAVIGAGAVVATDIPPYAVAVGVPAKVVKYRFEERKIKELLEIKWWDFFAEKLKDVEKDFFDIEKFIEQHKNA
ncbi:hypothetical protein LK994_12585 [Ferruginibacter lapsinanis]|uniref:DapH/DapD/GlmU-related protein n=1 Tax=Ferruginibacter lapsinanis TaxID=563172 RepID=UPI001E328E86|nr:DapH/DapD/GlmU-related protein [Ferruginibacter lapsinanis]UEG49470.1 hypothetical protein LK994_12585 [Ferruginibacter lapsinanis]